MTSIIFIVVVFEDMELVALYYYCYYYYYYYYYYLVRLYQILRMTGDTYAKGYYYVHIIDKETEAQGS